jgi:hypothetical protein
MNTTQTHKFIILDVNSGQEPVTHLDLSECSETVKKMNTEGRNPLVLQTSNYRVESEENNSLRKAMARSTTTYNILVLI